MNSYEVEEIKKAILNSNAKWEAEENFIMQMPKEERKILLGYTPGPEDPMLKVSESIANANMAAFKASIEKREAGLNPPSSYDLRNVGGQNFITSIKNQGSCGSCVAFGVAATVEGAFRVQLTDPTFAVDYSEAHLFYCHARSIGRTCAIGWWPSNAFDFFRDAGVAEEACYPYTAGDQNCSNLCPNWVNGASKVTSWHRITSPTDMKQWIALNGPLSACFTVYNDFFAYSSGIYTHVTGGSEVGGHCVSVVGYDDLNRCWICKNSWGPNWGESGFFRIAYGEVGIDAFMDAVHGVGSLGWGGPALVGDRSLFGHPSAVSWAPGRIDVFNFGDDRALYHNWWDGSNWNGPESLGGHFSLGAFSPWAVSWAPGNLDIFGIGPDRKLYHKWFYGSWGGPESLGGSWNSTPNAVSWAPGRLDVFGLGTDSALWHMWADWSDWGGPESLGGTWSSQFSAVSWGPGRLDVFGLGTDSALWHKWWDGSSWNGPEHLGGSWTDTPSAVAWGPNRIDVFGLNSAWPHALEHKWWDGSRWNGPESLGGRWRSAPSAVSWGPNRLDVFGTGGLFGEGGRQLHHKWWDGSRWNGPESLGGRWGSNPSAVTWGPGHLDVYGIGSEFRLEHIWRG
jgi:C1A family cysteine protease